ncbi:MAG: very short patch repair endonuclease [Rhodopila sp.]|nr:very short patch repair endonuclease [Rhodopila sp.]
MVDVLTPTQRHLNMSRIRGQDTKPELQLRRGLHALGFRFRLYRRDLPGRPDLVFPGRCAVIFAHGCFWHGHDCPMCRMPATRTAFWATKIASNRARDQAAVAALQEAGWRVMVVWECALRGPARLPPGAVMNAAAAFLTEGTVLRTVEGNWRGSGEQRSTELLS